VSFARPTRQMHAHPAGQRVHQAGLLNCRTHVRSCLSVGSCVSSGSSHPRRPHEALGHP
jgi:hypothetical protein